MSEGPNDGEPGEKRENRSCESFEGVTLGRKERYLRGGSEVVLDAGKLLGTFPQSRGDLPVAGFRIGLLDRGVPVGV